MNWQNKRILIVHYRVGKTDGVSLEITNWQQALVKAGADVKLCAGIISDNADFVIDGLEYELDETSANINKLAYTIKDAYDGKNLELKDFAENFGKHVQKLQEQFFKILNSFHPDLLIVSNIFSVGENLCAAAALAETLNFFKIPTIAVHHDFYWEECRRRSIPNNFTKTILQTYLPPVKPWIRHSCLSSLITRELKKRNGIRATIIPDCLDFSQPTWQKTPKTQEFLQSKEITEQDIILMQATRIVRRKNIELAVFLAKTLQQPHFINKLAKTPLYDGRVFNPNKGKITLLLTGYAEKRDEPYFNKLKILAQEIGVRMIHVNESIASIYNGGQSKFAPEQLYPFADAITYPSAYEGFGNQFLETAFARKPVIIFEYPVFKADIKPKGFQIISLGSDFTLDPATNMAEVPKENLLTAAEKLTDVLTNQAKYKNHTDTNFLLARKYYSPDVITSQFGRHWHEFEKNVTSTVPAQVTSIYENSNNIVPAHKLQLSFTQ